MGKVYNNKSSYSGIPRGAGLGMKTATAYLRWTATVCEEGYSSLDMVLQKKNIKPIKMTNIASIFLSPSVEMPLITHL